MRRAACGDRRRSGRQKGEDEEAGGAVHYLPSLRSIQLWPGQPAALARAAHELLGPGNADATLVQVDVPATQATWIRPGSCANRVGYWHVAGSRVVYRTGSAVRSFGIKSLISWRGTWYVVHLGAVVHHSADGVVDSPASGVGTPGPPGGC